VWVHPKFSLVPVRMHGAPANVAPIMFVPSSLINWASSHDVGQSIG